MTGGRGGESSAYLPTMILVLPVLATIIGLLMWALAAGKVAEIGKILFAAGVLVTLFVFAQRGVHLP